MNLALIASLIMSALTAFLVVALTVPLKSAQSKKILLPFLIASVILLTVLGLGNLDTYPYSNLAGLAFAISAGSLLGKGAWKRKHALFIVLFVVAALDIASFVAGAQGGSPPSNASNVSLYINFTVKMGPSSSFRVGILDLALLSSATMFFVLRRVRIVHLLAISIISLLLPFAFRWIPLSGGLPLTPFIALVVLVFQSLAKTRPPHLDVVSGNPT